MGRLKTSNAARQHDGLAEIFHQGLDDKEQGVGVRETGEIFTAVIVHDDLLPVSLLQRLLSLFGSCEVCKAGFALLQSLAIESIAAVDINGSFDMAHVVGYERSAVQQEKMFSMFSSLAQSVSQCAMIDGFSLCNDEAPLDGVALTAGGGGQADGGRHQEGARLQSAPLGRVDSGGEGGGRHERGEGEGHVGSVMASGGLTSRSGMTQWLGDIVTRLHPC